MEEYNEFIEKDLHKENKLLILSIFPISFLIFGIVYSFYEYTGIDGVIEGLLFIFISPTTLLTDFLKVGGIGATFLNVAMIGFFNLYILKHFKLRINGLLIAAFLTVIGFSFFGKNVLNIMPIFLGGYLYSRYQRIPVKNIVLVIMFSTALSPIVSEITFGGFFLPGYNYIMGTIIGVLIGFIIVPLSSHMLKFHDGFNLYNIGFTAGIIGTVFTSFLKNFNRDILPVSIIYEQQNIFIILLLLALFIYLVLIGYFINKDVVKQYPRILRSKGRLITDFTVLDGYGVTFFNMGILGLLSLTLVLLLGGTVNGPVIAGIFTIVGFGAFGKHPKNCYPIIIGVLLCGLLYQMDYSSTSFIITVLFSTTIAPIAGTYGVIIGILSGGLHLTLVNNVGIIHGGMNLYNNGFSGGIVASFVVPMIDAFKKESQ
ncbi:DUF1576 domain-containing protein [Alkalibaculum sp. M08DMB]|uniref:DUF1576 domain-containing protein n=1 Tax=Alkalibaculum sporogenes TaxID=2655001 RepID=A0A6A7K8Q0_9FIRM|nr:DUF1576 domain-containing protein [Alkalibaculum sporogenes]MPW25879.1 DUF1576 domain-containing protein [Alkalibaculum sporogenes]